MFLSLLPSEASLRDILDRTGTPIRPSAALKGNVILICIRDLVRDVASMKRAAVAAETIGGRAVALVIEPEVVTENYRNTARYAMSVGNVSAVLVPSKEIVEHLGINEAEWNSIIVLMNETVIWNSADAQVSLQPVHNFESLDQALARIRALEDQPQG